MLTHLQENLKKCEFVKSIQAILTANIPVLKIFADPSIVFEDFEITN